MKKIRSLFIMDKSFRYNGSLADFNQKMATLSQSKNRNDISVEKNKNEYIIFAKRSFGTIKFSGGGGSSIKIHVCFEEGTPEEQLIRIFSYLRPENYFLGIAFILSFISVITSTDPLLSTTLFIIGLFVFMIIWFNFIYKVQEEILMEMVTKRLKLRELKDKPKPDKIVKLIKSPR